MTKTTLFMFLGMAAVTALPRIMPAFFMGKIKINRKIERFLQLIPYTAMAALIFPGILSVDQSRFYMGLAGGAVAMLLSFLKMPVMVSVLAAVVTDFLLYILVL